MNDIAEKLRVLADHIEREAPGVTDIAYVLADLQGLVCAKYEGCHVPEQTAAIFMFRAAADHYEAQGQSPQRLDS